MFKRFLSTLFSVALMFSFVTNSQNAKAEESKEIKKNKAIIVLPGTFASGLFYRGETCTKYYKNEAAWMALDDNSKWRMVKGVAKFKLFYEDLFCDENGEPVNKNIGLPLENEKFPHQVDADIAKYGVGNSCKKLIDNLAEEFAQLDKIAKFISVAVPYNGTVEPFYVLNKGMLTENDFMGKVIGFLGIPNIIKNMAKNCGITYQMLPSKNYFERAESGYISDIKGRTLNYEETLEFLKDCNFAKKADGTTKKFLDEPQKIYDSLIVNGTHILNCLDYHIIAGCGLDTMSKILPNFKKQGDIIIQKYVDGDGSIAINESAIPFDNIENSRIFKIKGRHQFLIGNDKVVENIVNEIKNQLVKTDKNWDLVA